MLASLATGQYARSTVFDILSNPVMQQRSEAAKGSRKAKDQRWHLIFHHG